ncbi:hypothetical protein AYO20_06900 [Fonsecaea nubica]|uniref:Uncharacterized protein n=1 Tax=Fonsecaea nubica TaxID=856822 RepID=A0A178CVL5_9EURO|nr:hypothetical protein AYO20_06900 [Fonsecaea nubica]OAL33889.1 hypothetical protein AYO20_06900 [Fonsecaea nubica]
MASNTLLEFLTAPNPTLDCTRSSVGANTFNANWDPVSALEDWPDFNYDILMQSYGHVLLQQVPPMPGTSPPLTPLATTIFTEETFNDVLSRAIMPQVSEALRVAWPLCHPDHNPKDVAEIAKGAKAKRGTTEEDNRFYPDWAAIRESQETNFGYKNLCPGETKLASKWSTSKEGRGRTDYLAPFDQIQTYCGRQWGAPHGYIITPEELVVVRVSRESIGPGLAASRPIRTRIQREQPAHSRTFSTETVSSGLQAMSLDTGSSFSYDTNPNIEYGPLQFKSIPWKAEGKNKMTVKLALWWLNVETGKDLSVQDYPPSRISDHRQVQQPSERARAPAPLSGSGPGKGKRPAKT